MILDEAPRNPSSGRSHATRRAAAAVTTHVITVLMTTSIASCAAPSPHISRIDHCMA